MNTRKILSSISIVLLLIATMTSCSKDEEQDVSVEAPTIDNLEVGLNNSMIGHPGSDIHLEAEIFASGTIKNITVGIHPEDGTGWEFHKTYTSKYAGAKNATFHEHIDIPQDAEVGHYHLHLSVTDKEGNTTEVESELEIVVDTSLPSMENLSISYEGNDEVHIEGDITAPNKIEEILAEVHGGTYKKVFDITKDAVGKNSYHLHRHIHIDGAPDGNYHVHIVVKDQAGKTMEFEGHFDK